MGSRMSRMFALRSLLKSRPYSVLSIVIILVASCLAYMLKIIEGPVYNILPDSKVNYNNYSSFENCIWTVLVTMTTVGYGDFYPNTNLGRLILISTAIIGTILISLAVIMLQEGFTMNPIEDNAYRFYERIKAKELIQKKGAQYFKSTFQFLSHKNKFLSFVKTGCKDEIEYTRLKKNLTQYLYNRIKASKSFKNEFHYFRTRYEPFTCMDLIKEKMNDLSHRVKCFYQTENDIWEFLETLKRENRIEKDKTNELKLKEDLLTIREKMLMEKEKRLKDMEKDLERMKSNQTNSETRYSGIEAENTYLNY